MQAGLIGELAFEIVIGVDGTVHVCGDLDDATVGRLRDALSTDDVAAVDLSEVTFINLAGLRLLAAEARRRADAGRAFQLRRPSRSVRRLADLAEELSLEHLPWDVAADGPRSAHP